MWYVKKSFCQVDHFFIFPHTSENMKNRWLSAAWLLHRWFTLTRGTSSHISSRMLFFLFFALVALDHTRNLGSTISISFHSDDWLSPVFAPFLSPYFFFYFFLFWVKMVQLVESRNDGLSASAETPKRADWRENVRYIFVGCDIPFLLLLSLLLY